MFTYIDPTVRERLIEAGKLVRIDRDGGLLEPDGDNGGGSISILGPIPLPLSFGEQHYDAQWYACVRNTELSKIEHIYRTAGNGLISLASMTNVTPLSCAPLTMYLAFPHQLVLPAAVRW